MRYIFLSKASMHKSLSYQGKAWLPTNDAPSKEAYKILVPEGKTLMTVVTSATNAIPFFDFVWKQMEKFATWKLLVELERVGLQLD